MAPTVAVGDWIAFGVVARAHGVRGELRVIPFQTDATIPQSSKSLRVVKKNGVTQVVCLRSQRQVHDALLVMLEGVADRDAASELAGAKLEIETASLPAPEAGELYLFELVGAQAVDETGAAIGVVESFYENRGQDVVVLRTAVGAERWLPLTDDTLRHFDRAHKLVCLRVPTGLWDD